MQLPSLPVYPLSIDEGIPLPGITFSFTIDREIDFLTKPIEIDGKVLNKAFLIGLSTEDPIKLSHFEPDRVVVALGQFLIICNADDIYHKDNTTKIECLPFFYAESLEYRYSKEKYECAYVIREIKEKYPDSYEITDVKDLLGFIISSTEYSSPELSKNIKECDDVSELLNLIAVTIYHDNFDLYVYSQTLNERERFRELLSVLLKCAPFLSISLKDLSLINTIKSPVDEKRSLFFNELLDKTNINKEKQSNTKKKKTEKWPKCVIKKYEKERIRLKRLPPSSLEFQTQLDYIELIQNLPWGIYSTELEYDLDKIEDNLNKTHQGLEEIKKNILHHFALEKHLNKPTGNVMCFLGPPGTGKTTIVKSIAEATGKKIIKIALGGMSDEAELRGHRRTYVASKPGRIIQSLVDIQVLDPIILLDEIDKISNGRDDPTNALLELLDPEQNQEFIDRYLELPIDVSKCLFIATANYKNSIPSPLLDRLDILEFKEYTKEEKLNILKNFSVPRTIKEFSCSHLSLNIEEDFYETLSTYGNREAEKIFKNILKKCIYLNITESKTEFTISKKDISNKSKNKKIGF